MADFELLLMFFCSVVPAVLVSLGYSSLLDSMHFIRYVLI